MSEYDDNEILDFSEEGDDLVLSDELFRTICIDPVSEGRSYAIYFMGEVRKPVNYTDLFIFLRGLSKGDYVKLYINSSGGDLFTAMQLVNAIEDSPAFIESIIDGMCFSCAPIIALACDKITINPNALVMFHNFSTDYQGKGNEILVEIQAVTACYRKMLKKYASKVLDKVEIDNLMHGRDYYFNEKELKKRLKPKKEK